MTISNENETSPRYALVTGSAGFIGFHTSKMLMNSGWRVIGVDNLSNYYDVNLKLSRESLLAKDSNFTLIRGNIEQHLFIEELLNHYRPEIIIHFAAQAGVRHSIDQPRAYLEANVQGTFELLEAARKFPPKHMLLASTSSAYGPNTQMPFNERLKSDRPLSFYAATKIAMENLSHSYAHLYSIPITVFRFFTVYGAWGRPDMALFKFTKAILTEKEIDIYNFGKMERDFTYIDDLVEAIRKLINCVPDKLFVDQEDTGVIDSKSSVAPFRVINIGNSQPIALMHFVEAIESALSVKAKKNFMPIQAGDVAVTWADTSLLNALTGFSPKTDFKVGVRRFIDWYLDYYVHEKF